MSSSTLTCETEIADRRSDRTDPAAPAPAVPAPTVPAPAVPAPAVPAKSIPREITTDLTHLAWRSRQRRRRLASLLLAVILPTALMAAYLYGIAADQYISEFRFSVRRQMPLKMESTAAGMPEAPAGMAAAMAVITDSQMVVQYLKSTQIIEDMIAAGVDLDAIYAGSDHDLWAHLHRNATLEERQRYWKWMVDPFFDMSTGIVSVEVNAFRPADAQLVASTALALCEKLMNVISARAHADSLAYATQQVAESDAKLQAAQAATAAYRNQHAVLFPEMQATADTTVAGTVLQGLIDARTAYATQLAQGVAKDAVQMAMLRHRITALESELQDLHGHLAKTGAGEAAGESLASVMASYSQLQVSEQNAAKVYERSLTLLLDARNEASQQSVYLATFVRPGRPEESLYPVRWRLALETALVSFVAWCLLQLIYHGIRDHID